MKYFPDRPDDVTCVTCPWSANDGNTKGKVYCVRNPPCRVGDGQHYIDGLVQIPDPYAVCGEHPWFVEQRAILDERARWYERREHNG